MKICCNVKENDARYCQGCLEDALLGRTKQVFDILMQEFVDLENPEKAFQIIKELRNKYKQEIGK